MQGTSIRLTQIVETDRARWERHARLLEAARQMESVARSARVAPCDSREMLQEAAELRAMARGIA